MVASSDVHLHYFLVSRSRLLPGDGGYMCGRRGEGHGEDSHCVIVGGGGALFTTFHPLLEGIQVEKSNLNF